jgi:hypothetical protein
MDVNGRVIEVEVKTKVENGGEVELELKDLDPGVYFLQILKNNDVLYRSRIVKEVP